MSFNYFAFNMLDSIQWYAMLTLSLTLFRLKPLQFWKQNIVVALLLKALTLFLKTTPLISYIALGQLLLITLAFHFFYRIRFMYAGVVAIVGGIIVFLSVAGGHYIVGKLSQADMANGMQEDHPLQYALFMACLIAWTLLLAWGVKRLRIGFTFVSSSDFKPKRRRGFHFELPLLLFLTVLFVLPPSSVDRLEFSPFLLVGISVSLVMLLAASYRREQED